MTRPVLRSSPTSPFGRKIKLALALLGLSDQVEIHYADTTNPEDSLRQQNPLGKIPVLVLADGSSIYDSRVILEYFDHLAGGGKLIPADPATRFPALTLAALGDGIMDAALLRRYDPMAMRGDYGHASLEVLAASKYFSDVEERAFRVWQRIGRDDLLSLVTAQPLAANLTPEQLDQLLGQVGELYDGAVRPGEALRLPFQLLGVRAWVDHAELTAPVQPPDSALSIPL